MRVISTKTHGAIDYLTGAGMLAAPSLLGISDELAAARTLRAAGLAAMAYSFLTDYEFGLVRVIPMPIHIVHSLMQAAAERDVQFLKAAADGEQRCLAFDRASDQRQGHCVT